MMRAMWVVIAVGCQTPYQTTMGFSGGVEARPIGNGVYVVNARVNGYTSQGTAIEYAYRRASEVCPYGYQVDNSAASSTSSYHRTFGGGVQEVNKPEVTIVVRCNQPAAAAAPAQAVASAPAPARLDHDARRSFDDNGTLVVAVDHWFWCFTAGAGSSGVDMCASTRELCERFKDATAGCTPSDRMTCFHVKVQGQERDAGWCFKTVDECKLGMQAWPGPEPITLGCSTLRYSPTAPASPTSARARDATEGERKIYRIDRPMFCFLDGEQGECAETLVECEEARATWAKNVRPPGACAATAAAACFDITSRMSGLGTRRCYANIAMCEQLVDMMSKEPDWQFSSKQCFVVRTQRLP